MKPAAPVTRIRLSIMSAASLSLMFAAPAAHSHVVAPTLSRPNLAVSPRRALAQAFMRRREVVPGGDRLKVRGARKRLRLARRPGREGARREWHCDRLASRSSWRRHHAGGL